MRIDSKRAVTAEEGRLLQALRRREPDVCQRFTEGHYQHVYRFFLWLTNDPETP